MVMDKHYQSSMQGKQAIIEQANAEFKHAGSGLYGNNKQKRKLLVMDDEPDICDFVAYVGRRAGYETLAYSQMDDFQTLGIDGIDVIAERIVDRLHRVYRARHTAPPSRLLLLQ
ncbi:MAG: hypothetical protein IIC20_07730 [Chloroflexi bacterium]|nr:hypothetical protein [Chloroflexota bacterium]